MKRTPLNPISPRQREKMRRWGEVTNQRLELLREIFGFVPCEWCGQPGHDNPIQRLGGHHLIKRQYNIHTPEVCFIAHWGCHDYLDRMNKAVEQFSFGGAVPWLRTKLINRLADYRRAHEL